MAAPYRHERWVCEPCGVQGRSESEARTHYGHPAGWKRGGNQHPEIDKWDPNHPDREPGFSWTVDWRSLALEVANRFPEGHKRRTYWVGRAAQMPILGAERAASGPSLRTASDGGVVVQG